MLKTDLYSTIKSEDSWALFTLFIHTCPFSFLFLRITSNQAVNITELVTGRPSFCSSGRAIQ